MTGAPSPSLLSGAAPTPEDYIRSKLWSGPSHWDWQRDAFLRSAAMPLFAELAEPRCGKSKPLVDTAFWRYLQGPDSPFYVDLVVIFAMPSVVPNSWALEQIPTHAPKGIPWRALVWDADVHQNTKHGQKAIADFFAFPGLRFLCCTGESCTSDFLLVHLRREFPKSCVMVAGDESTLLMKTAPPPAALRRGGAAKRSDGKGKNRAAKLYAIGHQKTVVARRILDGTPVGEGPMDLYQQFAFLDKSILGFEDFSTFKAHHSTMERHASAANWAAYKVQLKVAEKMGLEGGRAIAFADGRARAAGTSWWTQERDDAGRVIYRNLDELHAKIAPYSVRVRRRDVFNGPQPVFSKTYFEMTEMQRKVYEQLRDEYEAELHTGERVEARHVLTRMMRLQQVSRNYWPSKRAVLECEACDGEDESCAVCQGAGFVEGPKEPPRIIDPKVNPALDALMTKMAGGQQTCVWCRFHHEVDEITVAMAAKGFAPVKYDGRMSGGEKLAAKDLYTGKKANPIVGTARAGGRGVPLPSALLFYYCHEYSLLSRLQSQDRAEAPGNLEGTGIDDLICVGTKDTEVVEALRHKRKVSDVVLKERSGRWL